MDYPGKVITKNQVTPTQTSASGNWTLDDQAAAIKNNNWPVAGVPNPISKSLRFNSADSAYLNRTPASASNRRTWTWSGWIKRGTLGVTQWLFDADNGSTDSTEFNFAIGSGDTLSVGGSVTTWRITTQVFRDPSAWYHIVLAIDTTQATANNRIRLYVNGSEITAFSTLNNPTQNLDLAVNQAIAHYIGIRTGLTSPLSAYLTEVNFIDGQALTPSSFGMTNPQTGQWIPIKYSGTYGTNGFYLNFKDATSTTTLGYDYSGNANNWTTNNFSVTAGSGNDSLTDVPTPWIAYNTTGDVGGVVRGNYCTLNPLDNRGGNTTSDGNLKLGPTTGSTWKVQPATMAVSSGKWYFEVVQTAVANLQHFACGVVPVPTPVNSYTNLPSSVASAEGWSFQLDNTSTLYFWYGYSGSAQYVTISTSFGTSDVAQIAVDIDAGKIWVGKNNTWYNSSGGTTGNPATGANATATNISGTLVPFLASLGTTTTGYANFGQRPFAYTPPAGFLSLCSTNLPTPTIGFGLTNQGDDYFDINLWTGTGASRSITNSGAMQPDLVWTKDRSVGTSWHGLFDSVRGNTKVLSSNNTVAEGTVTDEVTSFNSDGFSLGVSSNGYTNFNGRSYVGWQWKANGAGGSNTAGTITSTVSANTTSGFSIVTYTGTGANATVGHGLGVAPSMVIVKQRDVSGNEWCVYNVNLPTPGTAYIFLNSTAAVGGPLATIWNSTNPTSSVFSVGTIAQVNQSTKLYVAYCFAPVAGYSAFGSYTGNGSADGPFVFCGFRPRYILIKRITNADNWFIFDTARNPYNVANLLLYTNLSNAEATFTSLDILSNGFKIRTSDAGFNASSNDYIYAAFAESPFKFANAR